MTPPEIETKSPGPLANTLLDRLIEIIARNHVIMNIIKKYLKLFICVKTNFKKQVYKKKSTMNAIA